MTTADRSPVLTNKVTITNKHTSSQNYSTGNQTQYMYLVNCRWGKVIIGIVKNGL